MNSGNSNMGTAAFPHEMIEFTIDSATYTVVDKALHLCILKRYKNAKGLITLPVSVRFGEIEYTVTEIGKNAFHFEGELEAIQIPNSIYKIGKGLKVCGMNNFYACDSIVKAVLPCSLSFVPVNAFGFCSKLREVIIPSSVTEIKEYAFQYSDNILKIIVNCKNPPIIKKGAFRHRTYDNAFLVVPKKCRNLYASNIYWGKFKNIIEEPFEFPQIKFNLLEIALSKDSQFQLVLFTEENAPYKQEVSWESSNSSVAKIGTGNILYAYNIGETIITATTKTPLHKKC